MKNDWRIWYLVFASVAVLGLFGRLDLLVLVVPLSAAVAFGSWLAKRSPSRGR